MIHIDNREHDCISYCSTNNIEIQVTVLEVGDIVVEHEQDKLIFERKTISDLAASIKDGRFREQKQRLLQYPFHRITYIIEGASFHTLHTTPTLYGISTTALQSALVSLSYRDGFHVIYTSSVEETMTYIQFISKRMIEHPEKVQFTQKETTEESYLSSVKVKTKKIDNITPIICYSLQLAQIPGISTKLAQDIIKMYPTLIRLITVLQEKGVKALHEVPGIGKKKSEMIITYLLNSV
jgi:crossover junction endonuclease MUS81